jgi:ribosomal protein L14
MIHELTNLKVVDNCGVKTVRVIRILGRKVAEVGTRLVVVVSSVRLSADLKAKRGEIVTALVVRSKPEFDHHAVVLFKNRKFEEPLGTRISGPISSIIHTVGYTKVASMATSI